MSESALKCNGGKTSQHLNNYLILFYSSCTCSLRQGHKRICTETLAQHKTDWTNMQCQPVEKLGPTLSQWLLCFWKDHTASFFLFLIQEETRHRHSSTLISCRTPPPDVPRRKTARQSRWLSGDETSDSHMASLNHLKTQMHLHVRRFGGQCDVMGHESHLSLSFSGMNVDKWRMVHLICPHQPNPTAEGSPLLHLPDPSAVEVWMVV